MRRFVFAPRRIRSLESKRLPRLGQLSRFTCVWFFTLSGLSQTPVAKATFLQGSEVAVSDAQGKDLRLLTHDGKPKTSPKWSPAGDRLMYTVAPEEPNALADIVILRVADGREITRFPIRQTSADGVDILNDMRGVEGSGWTSSTEVFVTGSASPAYMSYESFGVATGKVMARLDGSSFTTCPSLGEVAYIDEDTDKNEANIKVGGKTVLRMDLRNKPSDVTWSQQCDSIALLAAIGGNYEDPELIFVKGGVEEKATLPNELRTADVLALPHGFVVIDGAGHYVGYEQARKEIVPPSSGVDELLRSRNQKIDAVRAVGAQGSIDFWPQQ